MADAMRNSACERELEQQLSWMTDAVRHMLETGLTPVSWEQFGDTLWRNGETQFKAIE
jgi:hypothetical protein